ncbi:MAG TPA: hypothetical protein VFL91_25490 [Thermomicrobiales bacterium]|nr:hypothetical protein [Thermomicrobiales bacterium]
MKLTLSYDRRYGQMTIADDSRETVVFHSTVLSYHALDDLAEAVVKLLQMVTRATCAWAVEPGEHRWILERRGEEVQITILWFRDSFSNQLDEQGEEEFSAVCKLRRFAVQVKNVLQTEIDAGSGGAYLPSAYGKLAAALRSEG